MADRKFMDGDIVERIEDRDNVLATIVSAELIGDEWCYFLEYDEGGFGYWPESSLSHQ